MEPPTPGEGFQGSSYSYPHIRIPYALTPFTSKSTSLTAMGPCQATEMQLVHLAFSRLLSPLASLPTVFSYAVSTSQASVKNTAEEDLPGGENNPALKSLSRRLPESDKRLYSTPQLAACLYLLQHNRSPDDLLKPVAQNWLQAIEKDPDEQGRLRIMASEVVIAFKRDEIKDPKVVAEVVYLAPVLDKDEWGSHVGTT
ncbi:MAG: hypothetical protein J3Q66DRAFT_373702 [Benniella sp.]|nr:MAG: hypothetical protein J3Q66DRAFT_373702 [Benniella sp.]